LRVCFVKQFQSIFEPKENETPVYNRFLFVWTAENQHPGLVRIETVQTALEACLKKLLLKRSDQQ